MVTARMQTRARARRILALLPRIMNAIALTKIHTGTPRGPVLTFNQYQALRLIQEMGTCAVKDLADRLKIAASTTSQLVDRLVRAGLLHRTHSAHDRRRLVVTVSTAGKRIMDRRTASLLASYETILGYLSDRDQAAFERAFVEIDRIGHVVEAALRASRGDRRSRR